MRKAYRYEDSPWQTGRRRDGHLLRWAIPAKLISFFFRFKFQPTIDVNRRKYLISKSLQTIWNFIMQFHSERK